MFIMIYKFQITFLILLISQVAAENKIEISNDFPYMFPVCMD